MRPPTLRTTLTRSYAIVLLLFLTCAGVVYYHAFARQLDLDASNELAELTRGVHGYLRFEGGQPTLAYDRQDPDATAFVQAATRYYQIYDGASGILLTQSAALEPLGLHYTPGEVRTFLQSPRVFDVQTDRGTIRFSNSVISPRSGETYLVQVGVSLDGRDAALRRFLALLVWSLPVGLVAVLGIGRWMAGRALAPLAHLALLTREIDVDDLERRLPVRGAGDELDEVAGAFNDLLARLQHAVGEMKQFSAAMAHEIRTPLAALRASLELSLAGKRSPQEHRLATANQLEEIDSLARLVGRLLMLARAEAGELRLARAAVDFSALTRTVVETLEPVAAATGVTLTASIDDHVHVTGDAGWLERMLLNLVDNAIKFTPARGHVAVLLRREENTARLAVRDTGIGIAPEAIPRLFDSFYRSDAARSLRRDGAGLGLSLVKWIADRHRAAIDVKSEPGRGSTFTVRLKRISD